MTDEDRYEIRPLLDRVLEGDQEAYKELLARLRPFLHARLRQILGTHHAGVDASGIVQSVLRRVHEHFDALLEDDPTEKHLMAWVTTILRRRIIDELRKKAHDPLARGDAGVEEAAAPQTGEEIAERERLIARLARALARLPERRRRIVEMHWFEGLRDAQISEALGGSVEAIRVLRCRALKELRSYLEESHDDER